ncbi:MarR family transcriptional regulator [Castellaniella sp. FW104-16D08]|uniref:MarR family winged helix-turn-helix transcriptional regulator n=1 Tax=unclassified Castellaniella TaxID=2617606 RepID=UPI003315FB86
MSGSADHLLVGAQLLDRIVRLNRWVTHHTQWAVPLAQARVLSQISQLGPSRVGDLARAEHCSQPTMTTLVKRLLQQSLVRRVPDPSDARAGLVSLTPAGQHMLDDLRRERARVMGALIAQLAPAQRQGLDTTLQTLEGLLDAAYTDSVYFPDLSS